MQKVEAYLKMLASHIKTEIEEAVEENMIDYEVLDDIKDLCDDYNSVFKFAEHHSELMSGCLSRHYGDVDSVMKK